MDQRHDSFMEQIEKRTNVRPDDLIKLANSVSQANLRDEATLRQLIRQVAQLANRPVSKEKEDQIVQAILNNKAPTDFSSLAKMFHKK